MTADIDRRPQFYARAIGALYVVVIVLGGSTEGLVMSALTVPGDPAATLGAIMEHPQLWRYGLAANLAVPLIAVVQLWLEFLLLRPAGRSLALLFVFLNLASLAVEAVSKTFQLMVMPLAETDPQLAVVALIGHGISFHVALVFFGAACLAIGALIWRSGYLPRFIGVLMGVAGICYLVATVSTLFFPEFARTLGETILLPVLVGEGTMALWLLIMGINVKRWPGSGCQSPPPKA